VFVLTAGHCNELLLDPVFRASSAQNAAAEDWSTVGDVERSGYLYNEANHTDAEAIRVRDSGIVPQGIFGWKGNLIKTQPAETARIGQTLCYSGATTQEPWCGPVKSRTPGWTNHGKSFQKGGYWVKFAVPADHGDSGSPVWDQHSKASIGLVSAGRPEGNFVETLVEPLLHPPNMAANRVPGILNDKHLRPLSLKLGE
jgi:hypothetical protein